MKEQIFSLILSNLYSVSSNLLWKPQETNTPFKLDFHQYHFTKTGFGKIINDSDAKAENQFSVMIMT
jgi:hypothetical protein